MGVHFGSSHGQRHLVYSVFEIPPAQTHATGRNDFFAASHSVAYLPLWASRGAAELPLRVARVRIDWPLSCGGAKLPRPVTARPGEFFVWALAWFGLDIQVVVSDRTQRLS